MDMKKVKTRIEELKKNPEAEIYSQDRRVWETAVMQGKQAVIELEDTLIYRKAVLRFSEAQLQKTKELEEYEKNNAKQELS